MLKQVCMLSVLLSVSFFTKAMEEKKPLEKSSSREFPIEFNSDFIKNATETRNVLLQVLYGAPYFAAGTVVGVRDHWQARFGLPTASLFGLVIRASVLGFGIKVLTHKALVKYEIKHEHSGRVLDYSKLLKEEKCLIKAKEDLPWWFKYYR